jgi:multidrug efflux pump subunit AcrA (membrane-fusion protein)
MAAMWGKVRSRPVLAVVVVVAVLAIAGAGWWWFGLRKTDTTAAAAAPTTSTSLQTVSTGTITKSVSATGTVTPAVQDDVSFQASGKVTGVAVAQGDTVKKGQTLGTIDTVDLKASVASAQATLASANAKVANDETSVTDAQTAVTDAADTDSTTDDTTAAAQLATAKAQLTADQAAVATAQQQVTAAQTSLSAATLTSPIDGIVAEVNVSVGDQVSGGSSSSSSSGSGSGSGAGGSGSGSGSGGGSGSSSSSSSSSAQFLVVGTSKWEASLTVDDSEINLIKKGIQAQLTVSGQTSNLFGTVSSVGVISTSTSDTASYPVTVSITGTPTGLHDGSSATVVLIYQQLTDVLVVPTTAIHVSNGQKVVYQMQDGKQVDTVVQTGETSGTDTQITSGLAEGDQIVVTTVTRAGGTGETGTGARTGTRSGTGGYGGFGGGTGGGTGGSGGGFGGGQGGFPGGAGGAGGAPGGNANGAVQGGGSR